LYNIGKRSDDMFAEKLKEIRKSNNITQEELASYLSISKQAVSSWEIGKSEPDTNTIKEIANYFNVTVDYLVGGSTSNDEEYNNLYNEIMNNPDLKIVFREAKEMTTQDLKLLKGIIDQIKAHK
jgi:transcriptional regulator with XRE-family HTH domain